MFLSFNIQIFICIKEVEPTKPTHVYWKKPARCSLNIHSPHLLHGSCIWVLLHTVLLSSDFWLFRIQWKCYWGWWILVFRRTAHFVCCILGFQNTRRIKDREICCCTWLQNANNNLKYKCSYTTVHKIALAPCIGLLTAHIYCCVMLNMFIKCKHTKLIN